MQTIWFMLVAVMIAVYVVLDGFDLGAGIVHLLVARTDRERRQVLRSIGPVWDGNEVWLLAGGGTLYFAFPALYASSFSGFYLPLMMVLWLLILRGISIEFRNHIDSLVWKPFWDVVFGGASALLAIFFGAALGNVVRGVPLDDANEFFLPLWTNFGIGREVGILDWYTVLVAVAAFATLLVHGALWVALKTDGELERRARKAAQAGWWALLPLTAAITWCSFAIQPRLGASFGARPWGYVFPLLAVAGLIGMRALDRREPRAVLVLVAVHRGDADQRGVRAVSLCAAVEHRPAARADGLQRGCRAVRIEGGAGVVHSGNAAGYGLLRVYLSELCGEGGAGG
jgi:cytochrome d ubiquinol oxidase subunit II